MGRYKNIKGRPVLLSLRHDSGMVKKRFSVLISLGRVQRVQDELLWNENFTKGAFGVNSKAYNRAL
jgi:hypothetical protein